MLPIQTPYASAANIFCTESISESSLHKQYISEWTEWTEWAEITVPGENKEVALSQLKLCLENNECSLDLS